MIYRSFEYFKGNIRARPALADFSVSVNIDSNFFLSLCSPRGNTKKFFFFFSVFILGLVYIVHMTLILLLVCRLKTRYPRTRMSCLFERARPAGVL